jgi:hypothetical protein
LQSEEFKFLRRKGSIDSLLPKLKEAKIVNIVNLNKSTEKAPVASLVEDIQDSIFHRKRSIGSDIVLNETINSKDEKAKLMDVSDDKKILKVDERLNVSENIPVETKPAEKASTTIASATITNVSSMVQ